MADPRGLPDGFEALAEAVADRVSSRVTRGLALVLEDLARRHRDHPTWRLDGRPLHDVLAVAAQRLVSTEGCEWTRAGVRFVDARDPAVRPTQENQDAS